MDFPNADPAKITEYHAHVYYDARNTKEAAARLRQRIGERFDDVRIGRWHDELVGPHLRSMYQVLFAPEKFPEIVPWLMLNREGLDVLVHPATGDAYTDHVIYGLWLGNRQPLNEQNLRRAR
jgi:aromatic ring-cleaving dioxygenase